MAIRVIIGIENLSNAPLLKKGWKRSQSRKCVKKSYILGPVKFPACRVFGFYDATWLKIRCPPKEVFCLMSTWRHEIQYGDHEARLFLRFLNAHATHTPR